MRGGAGGPHLCAAGLFRVEGWVAAVDGRKLTIKMELRDGRGKLISEGEALHIGLRDAKVSMEDVFPGLPKVPPPPPPKKPRAAKL